MHFFTLLKQTFFHWKQTLIFHLAFAGSIMASTGYAMKQYISMNEQGIMAGAVFTFTSLWLWLLFTSYSLSADYSPLNTLKRILGIAVRGLLWPALLLATWSNPYTVSWTMALNTPNPPTGAGIGLSMAIAFTFLLTLFTIGHMLLAPWKQTLSNKPGFRGIRITLVQDINALMNLCRATWRASFPSLVMLVILFIPIAILTSLTTMLVSLVPLPVGGILSLGLSLFWFSTIPMLIIAPGLVMRGKMDLLRLFEIKSPPEADT